MATTVETLCSLSTRKRKRFAVSPRREEPPPQRDARRHRQGARSGSGAPRGARERGECVATTMPAPTTTMTTKKRGRRRRRQQQRGPPLFCFEALESRAERERSRLSASTHARAREAPSLSLSRVLKREKEREGESSLARFEAESDRVFPLKFRIFSVFFFARVNFRKKKAKRRRRRPAFKSRLDLFLSFSHTHKDTMAPRLLLPRSGECCRRRKRKKRGWEERRRHCQPSIERSSSRTTLLLLCSLSACRRFSSPSESI